MIDPNCWEMEDNPVGNKGGGVLTVGARPDRTPKRVVLVSGEVAGLWWGCLVEKSGPE